MDLETLDPQTRDLGGGFVVRRVLPQARRQAVGPFLFFDHFGPIEVGAADDHDVRAHPHIGLATVTYLFAGAMLHHDSTGARQRIEPGAINWMTAGRGIVHSEHRPAELKGRRYTMHGLQLWVALPEADEAAEPAFEHMPAERIPRFGDGGVEGRVMVGRAHGCQSPVATRSPTLFAEYRLAAGAAIDLPGPGDAAERALYGVDAAFDLCGDDGRVHRVPPRQMVVLDASPRWRLQADAAAQVVLVGGEPLGRRHMWWNFVASDPARIDAAAAAWEADTFGAVPGEAHDRIPLPAARFRARP